MRRQQLIVLKFGGSVLLDEHRLRIAVHEIYRWRREGWAVVAVVSALAGRTDELLERCERLDDSTKAATVACGEIESAALLGLHLDRAGVPSSVLSPGAVALRADGDPLDASPVSIDRAVFDEALGRDGVVVFPGFIALNEQGRTVTLGRGGSDLTALFLADRLGAKICRLIKDVDGLYESDPAGAPAPPRRFAEATYADALATDGSIIQHKAIRLAETHGIRFELGRFNGTRPTVVGAPRARFCDAPDLAKPLSIALLGLGTVGGGVYDLLRQLPELFEIRGVCVRDAEKHEHRLRHDATVIPDPLGAASCGTDVVVELIGGTAVASDAIRAALRAGSFVVTANKAALAADESIDLSRIACGAAVGGSLPVIERLRAERRRVVRVRGVLNGTSNSVLNRIGEGDSFGDAVLDAQAHGLAEADPSRDLSGLDALDKLRVIARTLGIEPSRLSVDGVDALDEGIVGRRAVAGDHRLRQVASIDRDGRAEVRVVPVDPSDEFHDLRGEANRVVIEYNDGSTEVITGRGAGRWPTAESVLGDLLELSRATAELGSSAREEALRD